MATLCVYTIVEREGVRWGGGEGSFKNQLTLSLSVSARSVVVLFSALMGRAACGLFWP